MPQTVNPAPQDAALEEEARAMIGRLVERALSDAEITPEEVLPVAALPVETLVDAAEEVSRKHASRTFNICAIVNAKSGKCPENCRWCSQSASWPDAKSPVYGLIDAEEALKSAKAAYESGASRFSLVMSGRKLSRREVRETAEIVRRLREVFPMEVCISPGLLTEDEFRELRGAPSATSKPLRRSSPRSAPRTRLRRRSRRLRPRAARAFRSARAGSSGWAKTAWPESNSRWRSGSSACRRCL